MGRGAKRTTVDRAKFRNYMSVADSFHKGAELARQHEYWNAPGVLIVHAAIAYADAIAIKLGGVKSQGEQHQETVDLLHDLLVEGEDNKGALNQLRRIIDHKTAVSYSGKVYNRSDVEQLWKQVERFRGWAMATSRAEGDQVAQTARDTAIERRKRAGWRASAPHTPPTLD